MTYERNPIEAAMELARTGEYPSMSAIKTALKQSGHCGLEPHFAGAGIRKQLRAVIAEARRHNEVAT